jgi:tetratricopeptide (TPR) repeat protein
MVSDNSDTLSIGAALRQARQAEGISLTSMATLLGLTKGHLSGIETGRVKPSLELLQKYERALKLKPGELSERKTQEASMPLCEVVILTALTAEYQAVLRFLQDPQEIVHPSGFMYHWGRFPGESRTWSVVVAEIGMGNVSAAIETGRVINYFHPNIALLVGLAGGLKDVKLGDVVVGEKIYYYESGKAGHRFEPRPEISLASYELERYAQVEAHTGEWLARLDGPRPDPPPQVFLGALASGEKVLASTQSSLFNLLKDSYSDTLAVDMGGYAFLETVRAYPDTHTHGLVIRGIADLIDNKYGADDSIGMRAIAARNAAAFAFQVLAKVNQPLEHNPSPLKEAGKYRTENQQSSQPAQKEPIWNVPYVRNPYFTGRDEILDRLHQLLAPAGQNDVAKLPRAALTQPQAIKGLGGIGKTQIAVEYAYRCRDLNDYTHTLWVNAATEETIISSFMGIAELLPSFSVKNETDQQKLVEDVKRWLEQCEQPWLLIFDNADDLVILPDYLPRRGSGGILLTTRTFMVGGFAASIEVETMGIIEGAQLLLRRAQLFEQASDDMINEAGNIVIALDSFPLALDQAGAYIEETGCSLADYLPLYQNRRRDLLAIRGMQATSYPTSIATTWSLSFQKVEQANPAAAELLHLCAFLAPDQIPEELIIEAAAHWPPVLQQAVTDIFTFNQLIAELLKFSLIKRLPETHMLSIHRLIQAVQMDLMEFDVQRSWAERVVRAVNEVFPDSPKDIATWPQGLRYLDQAQACSMLAIRYHLPLIEAGDLLNRTGLYLHEQALYLEAEQLYQSALHIREQQLGTEHPQTAASLNNLAELYRSQGKYEEAEPLYQRALAISERILGTGHPQTAASLNNLAGLYYSQGKYEEAELLYQQALAISEQILGAEHPDIATNLNNLALLYDSQGKQEEAEILYRRALAIGEQVLGAEHPQTKTFRKNYIILLKAMGKDEASKQ